MKRAKNPAPYIGHLAQGERVVRPAFRPALRGHLSTSLRLSEVIMRSIKVAFIALALSAATTAFAAATCS